MKTILLKILITVYNEHDCLPLLYEKLGEDLEELKKIGEKSPEK